MSTVALHPISFLLFLIFVTSSSQNIIVQFDIDEEKSTGTVIGNVAETSNLAANMSAQEFQSLRYSFLGQTKYSAYLRLNNQTGILSTAVVINRETVCPDTSECKMEFDVAVNSDTPSHFSIITIKVFVNDINDNAPTFPKDTIDVELSESSAVGYTIPIPEAVDLDTGNNNGIVMYEIFPANGTFALNTTKRLDGSVSIHIVLNRPLDREDKDMYVVYVFARDGGTIVQNTGKLQVNIFVLDANDNRPVFSESVYNKTMSEDTSPGTTILRVTATDKDIGNNSKIVYGFSPHQADKDTINSLFSIVTTTGDIFIIQKLVYELNKVYTIYVEASDQGKIPLTAQAKVIVQVEDAGNNAPIVKINLLSGSNGTVAISESFKIDAFVAHVNVEDSDIGDNGKVSCSTSSSYFGIESLTGNDYKVVIKKLLDREVQDHHNVTVTCSDMGTPVMSSSQSFMVSVVDDNDNDPVFQKPLYLANIDENNARNTTVAQVSATDKDKGVNAQLRYYLHSDAGSNFLINPNTGVIRAGAVFDRETKLDYRFRVLAVDSGDPPRTGTTSVVVSIGDINDNKPKFNQTIYAFEVRENKDFDSFVGQVYAYDLDSGLNSNLRYFMAEEDKFIVPFVVFPTGQIKTDRLLDREYHSQYNFVVIVSDQGNGSFNSSAYVTVYVTDENDNEPIIIFPNKMNNTVSSPVTSLPITTIRAKDEDEGINKKLTYYIHSGNENGMFYLQPESGQLFLNKNFPISKDQSVSLLICVRDSGTPAKTTCAQLNTEITLNNATAAPNAVESDNKYIYISIGVIVFTIIISILIIVIILVIRKIDRKRQKQKLHSLGPLGVPMQNGYLSNTQNSNLMNSTKEEEYMEQKKEVTSPNSNNESGCGSSYYTGSYSNINAESKSTNLYDKPPSYTSLKSQQQRDNQIEALNALKLQQLLLKTEIEPPPNQLRVHPGDNHSETSGETTTSDSGRGGSEDEVPNSALTPDDSRSFELNYNNQSLSPIAFVSSLPRRDKTKVKSPVPPIRTVSHYSTSAKRSQTVNNSSADRPIYNSAQNYSNPYLHNPYFNQSPSKNSQSDLSWDYINRNNNPANYPSISKDYFGLRLDSTSIGRSRDDDDDATTTSGSYTVNPEELDEDIFSIQKDLVV